MKKQKKLFEPFESKYDNGKFHKISDDMVQSKAWKELEYISIFLYFYMKTKFTKYKDGTNNANNISIPKSEYSKLMTQRTFEKNIDQLINLGFIKVVRGGYNTRECTLYGFSAMWKEYGTDDFKINPSDKRSISKK